MFDNTPVRQQKFHAALDRLSKPESHFVSFSFFSPDEIASMIADTADLSFRAATPVVGNNVHQDMEVCFPAPRIASFEACASLLEDLVCDWPDFDTSIAKPFALNDFAVQRYGPQSKGIGIHKDGLRYRNLVFIICLDGVSRLFHCQDRQGHKKIAINDAPGRIVILKAPGFVGFDPDRRVLHGVDRISKGRLSIGFRCEAS